MTPRLGTVLLVLAVILLAPLAFSPSVGAQEGDIREWGPPPGHDPNLRIGLTEDELGRLGEIGRNHFATTAPVGPVRAAAEWDESRGVFCLWDNAELMMELQRDNDLYIITTASGQAWWVSWLQSNGIPLDRVQWLFASTNTWWVRDYGPIFLWDGNGDFGLVDHIYNRPRPLDDVIPGAVSSAYGIPYYASSLVHTGGNYYADGYGNAWSSTLVYSENPSMTREQVNEVMSQYLGIDRYVTADLKIDIEHFDTFGKLVAPDILVWSDFPLGKDHRGWSEAALAYYRTLASPYDRPYRIHRMPLWSVGGTMTAYINALMTENKVLVSKHNLASDDTAVAIFQQACPGYQVVKVNAQGTDWGDSIHCRTRNFVVGDGVRIYAYPPGNVEPTGDVLVRAEIYTNPSTSLDGNPQIFYSTTGGAPFDSVEMAPGEGPNDWEGWIPMQAAGTTVSFYVSALDLEGHRRFHPPVAPTGLHSFLVDWDTTPPELEHALVTGLRAADWPPTFVARAVDDTCVPEVRLEYKINGVLQSPEILTRVPGTFLFEGAPTAPAVLGDVIGYRIVAVDSSTGANAAAVPPTGWEYFALEPSNRVCIIDLDKTAFSGSDLVGICSDFGLSWEYTKAWPASLSDYDAVLLCLGMYPHNTQLSTAQANALVSFLNAGGAAFLEGGNAFAQDSARTIYRPYFGIGTANSGSTLTGPILGVAGEATEGMSFQYDGDAGSSDDLVPGTGASSVLVKGSYGKAVVYSTGTYATVGTSHEFCGLIDGVDPSHAKKLAAYYLRHLGLGTDLVVHGTAALTGSFTLDLTGTPGDHYKVAYSRGPGYKAHPLGIVRIDLATKKKLYTGVFDASGELHRTIHVPDKPALLGLDVYFQALIQPAGGGDFLTNRDRIRITE